MRDEGTDKKITLRIYQNTPFQMKSSFLLGKAEELGPSPKPFSGGRDNPPTSTPRHPQPRLLDPPVCLLIPGLHDTTVVQPLVQPV